MMQRVQVEGSDGQEMVEHGMDGEVEGRGQVVCGGVPLWWRLEQQSR